MKKRSKIKSIIDIIIIIILMIIVIFTYKFYKDNDFNDFILSEKNLHTSQFSRDSQETYNNKKSYKITSENYNDAMFFETITVKKDTPYKVTCMVKTKGVDSENNSSGSGAQISIEDTTERSVAISGTSDWQQIEMIFNSKNREEVNVGFRLGGYIDDCKGEAWFSNFKIEEGKKEDNSDWKYACFIFENLNATVNDEELNYSLSEEDITDMRTTIKRFENAAQTMSEDKMTAECDVYKIDTPISSLSYDEEYGYYVAPEDVEAQIKDTINTHDYDHIFIIFKLDDKEVKDWVGLGAMDYYGIGFSNIRLTNNEKSYLYKYDVRINKFPEEVLLHEFLHTFERTLIEYGYDIPALHDNEKYGYKFQALDGLKKWYADYMNCAINTDNGNIGLDSIVYTLKPAKESNFKESKELEDIFNEPQNILEDFINIFNKIKRNASMVLEQI